MNIASKFSAPQQYSVGNQTIPTVQSYSDLGVIVDNELTFREHILHITSKAQRRIGLLFKCFISRDADTLVQAFVTHIRPSLEYASSIWSPYQIGLIDRVESVQRRFTKRIPGLTTID